MILIKQLGLHCLPRNSRAKLKWEESHTLRVKTKCNTEPGLAIHYVFGFGTLWFTFSVGMWFEGKEACNVKV